MFAKKSEIILLSFATLTIIPMFFIPLSLYVLIPFIFMLLFFSLLLFFFRDPKRISPNEKGAFVSPAEGKILDIINLEDGTVRIQIKLSLFNVHVNRAPLDCKVINLYKEKGAYWPVWYKNYFASKNARQHFDFTSTDDLKFRVTQISGVFAWRCVSYVKIGDELKQNDRIGLIRFGSATHIDIPKKSKYVLTIKIGDKVRAGETIIAKRK